MNSLLTTSIDSAPGAVFLALAFAVTDRTAVATYTCHNKDRYTYVCMYVCTEEFSVLSLLISCSLFMHNISMRLYSKKYSIIKARWLYRGRQG